MSVVGLAGLLVRRQAWRDGALLVVIGTMVAVSVLAAVAGPRLARDTLEDSLHQAVLTAGRDASLSIQADVGAPISGAWGASRNADSVWSYPDRAANALPAALAAVVGQVSATVVSPGHRLLPAGAELDADVGGEVDADAEADLAGGRGIAIDLAAIPSLAEAVEVVEGRLPEAPGPDWSPFARRADGVPLNVWIGDQGEPGDPGGPEVIPADPIEVVLPADAAAQLGVAVGDELGVRGVDDTFTPVRMPFVVVGTVRPHDVADVAWLDLPGAWDLPVKAGGTRNRRAIATAYTSVEAMTVYADGTGGRVLGRATIVPDAALLTPENVGEVAAAAAAVLANPPMVGLTAEPTVTTGLSKVLGTYLADARAATAQMSVAQAGVVVVAAIVLLLLASLLVLARSARILLERARGSAVLAIAVRLLMESVVVTTLGAAVGLGAAHLLVPGGVREPWLVAAVLLVALLGAPALGAWRARQAWAGRRVPANRRERALLARHGRARRVVAEVGVLVLAGGAVAALRSRGLLTSGVGGPDPLLALAPALIAVAAAVVLLRLQPAVVAPTAALGRRSRGALALVGSVQARRSVAVLPLVALTVGTAVAVSGAVLVETVRAGQDQAAWDRIGADVRVDGASAAAVRGAAGAPGVTAVGSATVIEAAELDLGSRALDVTFLAVDAGYADLARALPGGAGAEGLGALEDLAGTERDGAFLPAVVDEEVAAALTDVVPAVAFRGRYHRLEIIGTTDHRPFGQHAGPFVYVDTTVLGDGIPPDPTVAWVLGPGAADAVEALDVPEQPVSTRADWLAQRRGLEQLAGVERLTLLGALAVLALAAVALAATVVAGARARGQTLAMLRTLGMPARAGWWLALAEVGPLVLSAVVVGATAGVGTVLVLGGALGLDVLTGGVSPPPPVVAPEVLAGLAAGTVVLVVLAVLVEVVVHRRDRLTHVLRAGETS